MGISGVSNDTRELIKLENQGEVAAKLALDVFVYRVKKYIGSFGAVLGGLDMLIFTGTIGERSFIMRSRICHDLQTLGIVLDEEKNKKTESVDAEISSGTGSVKIAVLCTDEMGEMAREMIEVLK